MKSTHSTYKKHKKTRHHRRTKTSPGQRSNCEPAKRVLSAKHPLKLVIASRNGSNAEVSASYSEGRRRSPEEYEGYAAQKLSDKKGGDLLQPNVPVNKRQFLFQKQLRQKNLRLQKQNPQRFRLQPQIQPPVMRPQIPPPPKPDCGQGAASLQQLTSKGALHPEKFGTDECTN